MSFSAQGFDWIHMRRASRRKKTGEERGGGQGYTRGDKDKWIAGTNFVQDLCENAAGCQ
jgi:hypothetical protein